MLNVLIAVKGIRHQDTCSRLTPNELDDKKLAEIFEGVIQNGVTKDGRVDADKAKFSREFAVCLLRTRFLFDQYIIKRKFEDNDNDGVWSLESLVISKEGKNRTAHSSTTEFKKSNEKKRTSDKRAKINLMLQSALRVSYTSPKSMHWITELLIWLSKKVFCQLEPNLAELIFFSDEAERIAKEPVKLFCDNGNFNMGLSTPHIVFNYLDYLLWRQNQEKYDDFAFEFRTTVEHWYPQHPSEGTIEQWTDGVDQFGNLALLQRNTNSLLSNRSPLTKKHNMQKMIAKGSLKLRIMSDLTTGNNSLEAAKKWRDEDCRKHGDEMIDLLIKACELS